MSEWKKVKLGESCIKIGSGATPKGGSTVYTSNGTSFIRSQNVYNLRFDYNGLTYINDEAAEKLKGVSVIENDILLNITGDSVARTCIVPNTILPARVNQHVAIIRAKSELLNQKYLNYYLASPAMQAYMLSLAVGKGASRNAITKLMIENFEVPCPSLEVQCRIAEILSRYDSLIENYQKQIKLLEESAQRLYKEWFVDLRFPGYENTKIVDGVPEGWEKKQINDICSLITSGGTPSRNNKSFWDNGNIKWVKTKELNDTWIIDTEEHITETGLNNSSAKIFPPNTILMAIYASPTLGRLGILVHEACCNQAALGFIPNEFVSWQWLFYKLYELRDKFNSIARGAGQQNISAIVVKETEIVVPEKNIIDKYTSLVTEIFNRQRTIICEIKLLIEARDRLLPKLMGGEIEV